MRKKNTTVTGGCAVHWKQIGTKCLSISEITLFRIFGGISVYIYLVVSAILVNYSGIDNVYMYIRYILYRVGHYILSI